MEVYHAILERRSVRKYKDVPVPDDVLEKILIAGTYAPSATNLQPWYFVALTKEEHLSELRDIMGIVAQRTLPELEERFVDYPQVIHETTNFMQMLGNAPACILVFQESPEYDARYLPLVESSAAAVQNMLLAAWDLNVGTCWLTAPVVSGLGEEIQATFAPDKGALMAVITLGYPDRIPRVPRRRQNRYEIL